MTTTRTLLVLLALTTTLVACAPDESADSTPATRAELLVLLNDFLAGVDDRAVHDAFWAEDLVYTSSNGTRFGKAEILAGFSGDDVESPGVAYAAEDVEIRMLGDAAIVAFKLVGVPDDADFVLNYLNTGTFVHRDGRWQALAWQATKIPEPE